VSLTPGTHLGPYEIVEPLGAGGMGEVYRARDPRLGRDVAVKLVTTDGTPSPDRLRRFETEARAAAQLSHPNVVTVFDVGTHGGRPYLVLELLEGKILRDTLRGAAPSLREAVGWGLEAARGLGAAHDRGIVHRDLKPENLFLTEDGRIKILDFGLAKLHEPLMEESDQESPAETRGTKPGMVLGTVGYMAPEQVRGEPADARTDVFALGAVLYELVTRRRPFGGASEGEILAAILRDEPPAPSSIHSAVPPALDGVLRRCLAKPPSERFSSAREVAAALETVLASLGAGRSATAPPPEVWWQAQDEERAQQRDRSTGAREGGAVRRSRRRWLGWAAAGLAIAGAVVGLWRLRPPERPPPRLVQLSWTGRDGIGAFSPDGRQIAFSSMGEKGENWDIWVKIIGEPDAGRLTTDPAGDWWPEWSPDGTRIAFVRLKGSGSPGSIHLLAPLVRSERRLADFPTSGPISWSPDGRWLAASRVHGEGETAPGSGAIHLLPAGGGEPRAVTFPTAPEFDWQPAFSPDGRSLAYTSCEPGPGNPMCHVQVLALDGELRPRGPARRVTRERAWISGVAWTRDGESLLYALGTRNGIWRVSADGGSPPRRVELAGRAVWGPRTARHSDRLAFVRSRSQPHICRLQRAGPPVRLVESAYQDFLPHYSPDGLRIVFTSDRSGERDEIWLADADGSNARQLSRGPGRHQRWPRWSPDGRSIAFDSIGEDGRADVWSIGVDGSGLGQITHDPGSASRPSWSRDGRLIYFSSDRSGRSEIWRVPAGGGVEEPVTHDGGCRAEESFDGKALYYMRSCESGALLARPVEGGPERTIVDCVAGYSVAREGVFYVDCGPSETSLVRYRDAATELDQPFGVCEGEPPAGWGGLSASPDARSVLYVCFNWNIDLMMIDDFR
jgi:Tol biopolymer transport system component